MKALIKKLESNSLSESERKSLVKILDEQKKCIEYYSQNFVGSWGSDQVNINWRAKKSNKHTQEMINEE